MEEAEIKKMYHRHLLWLLLLLLFYEYIVSTVYVVRACVRFVHQGVAQTTNIHWIFVYESLTTDNLLFTFYWNLFMRCDTIRLYTNSLLFNWNASKNFTLFSSIFTFSMLFFSCFFVLCISFGHQLHQLEFRLEWMQYKWEEKN